MRDDRKLVEDYRSAWEKYDLSLRELQIAVEKGDGTFIERLLLSLERARLQYRAARDRLAADMLGADFSVLAPTPIDCRIRDTAHLLWELSGKPQGTAENNWLCAERIVRYANGPGG